MTATNGCDSVIITELIILPTYTINVQASICDGDSLFVGGAFQTVGGFYNDTLTATNGCDSVVITELIILPTYTTNVQASICDGDSLFVGGAFQTVGGFYNDTLTAGNGCDSVIITELIILPTYTINVQASICDGDSLFVGGGFQTIGGFYNDTLTATNGCDSVVITELIILPTYTINVQASICDGDSLFVGGGFQTIGGFYNDTLTATNGCDSVVITELIILPTYTTNVQASICDGDSLFVGGGFQTLGGFYNDTLTAGNGCDSVIITELIILPTYTTNVQMSICDGDSLFVGGGFQTIGGFYNDTLTATNGCDSVIITELIILPTYTTNVQASICDGDSLFVGGAFQTVGGFYNDTLTAGNGCDSVIITELIILPTYTINVQASICDGDSLFVGGAFQTVGGFYNDTLTAGNGCDSVIITELIILPTYTTNVQASICDGDSLFVGGAFQTLGGFYNDTLTAGNGCDSVIITELIILPTYTTNVQASICDGDSLFVGGAFQTIGGFYNDTLTAGNGCDSVIITELIILPTYTTNVQASICDGDSLFVGGGFQTVGGFYNDTLTAGNGCDSVIITELIILPTYTTNVQASICDGDSLFVGGAFQTVGGFYNDTLTATNGCDSVVITELIILPTYTTNVQASICDGDSLFVGGGFQTVGGFYNDTLTAGNGCDSVIITELIILPTYTINVQASICDGDSLFVGGGFQTIGGFYNDTLTATNGCDSVVITELIILPTYTTNVQASICDGDSLFVGGGFQTLGGFYNDTLTAGNGCDSVIITELIILPTYTTNVQASICDGDSLFVGGGFQTIGGFYNDTLTATNGCDSVVITELIILPTYTTNVQASICDGDSLFVGGAFQTVGGFYNDTLTATNGCDSVVITELIILPTYTTNVQASICDGDSLFVGGAFQTVGGFYNDTLTATNGCDSVVITELIILPTYTTNVQASICDGDSLFVGGGFQTLGGFYNDTLTAGNGCDSVIITELIILPTYTTNVQMSICDGDSLFVGGAFQTIGGFYNDTLTATNGCDSVIITELIILPTYTTNVQASICDGDSLFVGGGFQTIGGFYNDTLTATNGCDSVIITELIILPTYTINVQASICDGDSLFVGGAFQTVGGFYNDTLTATNGCDSVVITELIILPTYTTNVQASICDGDSLFVGGAFQTVGGFYNDTLTAGNGCDSVIITELIILPTYTINVQASICDGDSLFVGGGFQTIGGFYNDTLTATNGCDSVVITELIILPTYTINVQASICDGDSLFVGGGFQTIGGFYNDTLTATNGCDSVVITELIILPTYTTNVQASICDGDSLFVGGGFQTLGGFYNDTLTAGNGCDSVIITELIILPTYTTNVQMSICDGDSLFVGGGFQTIGGFYNDTLTATNGCDSVIITELIILPTYTTNVQASICDGDSLFVGGAFQTVGGFYNDTLTAGNGCDSVIITELIILPTYTINVQASICDGDSLFVGGAFQTVGGFYNDTLTAGNGCDSVIITELIILPTYTTNVQASICDGDSLFVGGAFQTLGGFYNDTLTAGNGCDSVIITELIILPTYTTNVQASICDGDSLFVGGAFQTIGGFYNDTLTAGNGCDSVIITELIILPTYTTNVQASICDGDSLFVGGGFQTVGGFYNDTLTAGNGCDSVIITELIILPTYTTNVQASICDGDSLFVGGGFQTIGGFYNDTLTAGNGCDSVVITELIILPTYTTNVQASICDGDSLFVGGGFQTVGGFYNDTLTATNGCDSVVITELIILPTYTTNVQASICDGDSLFVGGAFQTLGGFYNDTLTAGNGCDSVIITELIILPTYTTNVQASICDGDSLFVGGGFQTLGGFYNDTLTAGNGCDSVIITELIILPTYTTNVQASICDGDSLFVGGGFQTVGGFYNDTLTATNGCDSVIITELIILPTYTTNVQMSICDGDSLFVGGTVSRQLAGFYT